MREGCGEATEVQWERFLPRTALRVLLVEADDSTRQIISALLRKCSYKVSAVPDGLKAWHILKGKHHNIDLVLTELELPSISGFALLSLVMEHDDCKSIPIIMMSSHDSVGMVLKCMLKGAADFLIKPVRKNELRNLWHHVWRRHTLAGGHIPPNLTAAQQKLEPDIDNNTASNHSSDYVISSSKDKDSREEGSDAQSSCTSFMEAKNAYARNVQGLSQPKCKPTSSLSNSDMGKQGESAKLPRESVIQESEIKENPSKFESDVAGPSNDPYKTNALRLKEDHYCAKALTRYESLGSESPGNGNITSEGSGNRREANESLGGAIDFIGTFDDHPICSHVLSGSIDGGSNKLECIAQLELSLRRICPGSSNDEKTDERHALSCSSASAISRYNNIKTLHSFFPTFAGTCTELEESSDKIRDLFFSHHSENTVGTSQKSPTLGDNDENTTSVIDVHSEQENIAFPRPIAGLRYGDLCEESVFYAKSDIGSTWSPKPDCQQEITKMNKLKQDYEKSDEALNNCDDQVADEEAMEELGQSRSSSLCSGIAVQVSSNGNVNGNRSDGVAAVENLNDDLRSVRWSEREAALTKFRLKRKDRCYEKKVRYQSRKRLAEQRPRVKGQFVCQLQTTIAAAVTATAADN